MARVARHLVNDRDFPAGPALKTAHSSTYDRNVRIKIRPQQECLARLQKVRDGYKAASEDCVRQGALGLFLSVHPPPKHLSRAAVFSPLCVGSIVSSPLCRTFRSPCTSIVSCFVCCFVSWFSVLSCRIFVYLSILCRFFFFNHFCVQFLVRLFVVAIINRCVRIKALYFCQALTHVFFFPPCPCGL